MLEIQKRFLRLYSGLVYDAWAIRTDINRQVLSDPAYEAKVTGRIPVGFIGQPEDVAHLVVFVASEEARYITGATLLIDGGLSL